MLEQDRHKLAADFCNVLMELRSIFQPHQLSFSEIRINSHSFHTLCLLERFSQEHMTMSQLAQKLQVTNQQLSKIINDLENKSYVERIHDKQNRRRVYIQITEEGRQLLKTVGDAVIQYVFQAITNCSEADQLRLAEAIKTLHELFLKQHTVS